MDVSTILSQVFEFILRLLELVFGFAGGFGGPGGEDDDDDEEDDD